MDSIFVEAIFFSRTFIERIYCENCYSIIGLTFNIEDRFKIITHKFSWRYFVNSVINKFRILGIFKVRKGLRGNLPSLLQFFLYDRSITVRIQNYFSHHLIQNGVPQGEVWSVPLFPIAINDLINCVTFSSPVVYLLTTSVSLLPPPIIKELPVYFNSPLIESPLGLLPVGSASLATRTILIIFRKSHSRPPSPLLSYISSISKSPSNYSLNSLV